MFSSIYTNPLRQTTFIAPMIYVKYTVICIHNICLFSFQTYIAGPDNPNTYCLFFSVLVFKFHFTKLIQSKVFPNKIDIIKHLVNHVC